MAKFVCSVCGYVHEDLTAPEQCPICTAPASGFSVVEDTPSQRRGTHTTNTKLDERNHTGFGSMNHPDSFIGIVIEPKCLGDTDKLNNGLAILAEEDPTFTVRTDEQSGQNIISGVGELHLDIIIDRLKREFKVECNMGKPQVNYKEVFTKTVEIDETYKKQSGGAR